MHRHDWKTIDNQFATAGEKLDPILLLPAIRPDFALRAPCADRDGNIFIGRRRDLATTATGLRGRGLEYSRHMTALQMTAIAVAFTVAGIAKGAIGMGMPPIAIGIMSFALPLESAIAIMVLPTMVTNIWQAVYGGGFRPLMRRFGTMAFAAMVGILGIGLFFSTLGSPRATGWVGVILVIYAVLALTAWRPRMSRRAEWWANPIIGLASGAVAGSTGVAAVPFLPYMQSLDMEPHELVQALGIMFLFITGMLAVSLALHGAYHLTNSLSSVAAVVPTMLGVWLGQKARRRLAPQTFRKIFLLGMLAIGLHLGSGLL